MLNYKNCQLCPRNCRVDRTKKDQTKLGYCKESAQLRIAAIEAHFGEEPPISGRNGSGTIFFTGCSLKCIFCQNYQISHQRLGHHLSIAAVVENIEKLIKEKAIHNINFVTPDHFLPSTVKIVETLRDKRIHIPIVYNFSGFQKVDSLLEIEYVADIYLPDFKYSDIRLARTLSNCEDYPTVALEAISEMVRQKGFLDSYNNDHYNADIIATRGVLVRHLILPAQIKNSIDALTMLFIEFGNEVPLSLMSQYNPIRTHNYQFLNRMITQKEFDKVYNHSIQLGFKHLFVQYPAEDDSQYLFTPDFQQEHPFPGNLKSTHN